MKTNLAPKKNDNTMRIVIDPLKVGKGHQPHRSGAGKHHDRRTNRLRTRTQQNRAALAGW
jgi:hypothetical protein